MGLHSLTINREIMLAEDMLVITNTLTAVEAARRRFSAKWNG